MRIHPLPKENSEGRCSSPAGRRRHGLDRRVDGPALHVLRVGDWVCGRPQSNPGGAFSQPSEHLRLELEETCQSFFFLPLWPEVMRACAIFTAFVYCTRLILVLYFQKACLCDNNKEKF